MWSQKEVEKVERKMLTKAVNIPLKAKKSFYKVGIVENRYQFTIRYLNNFYNFHKKVRTLPNMHELFIL